MPNRIGKDGKSYPAPVTKQPLQTQTIVDDESAIEKPVKPATETDAAGHEIESEKVRAAFAHVAEFNSLIIDLTQWYARANALTKEEPIAAWFEPSHLRLCYTNLRMYVSDSQPHAVCHHCGGGGCRVCKQTGYVSKFHFEHFKEG